MKMPKRLFEEFAKESSENITNDDEQEAESLTSEISEPATKLVRIDDENKSYEDKGIQVESDLVSNDSINVNSEVSHSSNQAADNVPLIDTEIITITYVNNESVDSTNPTTDNNNVSTEHEIITINNIDDNVNSDEDSNSDATAEDNISQTEEPDIITIDDEEECEGIESTTRVDEREEVECENSEPLPDELSDNSNHSLDKVDGDFNTCQASSSSDVNFQDNDTSTEIEIQDETSSSSSGVASITNSSDETATTSSAGESSEPERPLRSLLKVSGRKPKIKKKVIFDEVTVFYFRRSQGFTCVPSQGGSTLGMENTHSFVRNFTLETHEEERKRVHREILFRQRRFARMNKHSSTSESEDDSCDDLSDISDTDLENDSCYFLQPVPIKQRRALLRASGVRKIETAEKEDCRDIRLSREFCGCDCRVYCNPESCACNLAGIKCQVDRISFPCGCSRDGCANSTGRIEFNPLRVRTHFIHTIMRLEMEKKENQQQEGSSSSSAISTTDSPYSSNATPYVGSMPAECPSNVASSSSSVYLPVASSHSGYVHEPSMVMQSSNNSYMDPNSVNMYNEYSPDNSSYSENSDYTSDDFEEEYAHKQSEPVYQPPLGYINNTSSEMLPNSMESSGSTLSTSSACSNLNSNIILPPFPSISCDLSSNLYKEDHCQAYSSDSALQMSPYSSYPPMSAEGVQQSQLYPSYGMHTSAHYNYSEFPKNGYSEMSNSDSGSNTLCGSDHSIDSQQQQYIDLSLSIPSSAETLISVTTAGISGGEGSCHASVSFSQIQPMASNDLYLMGSSAVEPLCTTATYTEYSQQKNAQDTYAEAVTHGSTDTESGEDSHQTAASHSSPSDNFGEIIKKSIVESVSA